MAHRIQFTFVGHTTRHADVWADMDTVPRVHETVAIPGLSQAVTVVRTVVWYPLGDPDEGRTEPFVYVVLGSPRREAQDDYPRRNQRLPAE